MRKQERDCKWENERERIGTIKESTTQKREKKIQEATTDRFNKERMLQMRKKERE